jgi:Fe-S-cluster containining protein
MIEPLPAGEFTAWLEELRRAVDERTATDVPCGSCTACCRSRQFVHVAADEQDALAHIPTELLFPAPQQPRGNMVMGFDDQGRCPMLGETGCTIYAHRPRTCRTYDCRIFTAAGIEPDQPFIAERTARWAFDYADDQSRALHSTIRAAAAAVVEDDRSSTTQQALTAVGVVLSRRRTG